MYLPGHHYEAVQLVPSLLEVTTLSDNTQSNLARDSLMGRDFKHKTHHFYQHFSNKINVDDIIDYLEHLALLVADGGVLAGLVHPQGDAVDQDDGHGGPLEPGTEEDPDA